MEDIREERKGSRGKRGAKATKQCSTTPVVATAPCYVSMCGICCPACSIPRAKDENEIEKTRDKRYRFNAKEQGKRKEMREREEKIRKIEAGNRLNSFRQIF